MYLTTLNRNATLNCADVAYSIKGHNKFYIIQLLESDDKKKYSVWNRWGRVGKDSSIAKMLTTSL